MSIDYGTWEIFTRTWWKANPDYPRGLEPCIGPSRKIGTASTIEQARLMCEEWNASHTPGRLSRKAEFRRIG